MPTETFTADADFTIPDFVFSLTVALEGEAGEEGVSSVVQGRGGTVVGEISVTPGQTYHIRSSPGGDGNQGGGDSIDIRFGGTALTDRIAVAAGGGAGGDDADFGGIGTAGGDGGPEEGEDGEASDPGEAGLGGTQTAGGEGGTASFGDTDDGQAGSFGAGGDSGFRGGAGGAGWYGGGGAAGDDSTGDASGGGGGSNYAEGLDSVNANQRGTSPRDFGEGGLVTIEYDPLEPSLDVTNPTDTTTDLSWSITLPDNVDSVEEWQLYRDTDTGSDAADYTPIATYPPGTTSDTDTGLDQGTTYHYRMGSDVLAPSLDIDTLSAGNVTATSVDLTGDLVSLTDASSADVRFEYTGGTDTTWTETPIQTLGSPQTFSETVSGLDPETEYVGRAVGEAGGARDVGGVVTWTTPEGITIPDSAVAQLNAQNLSGFSDGDIVSTWVDQVAGNDATGSATYRPSGVNGYPALEFNGVDDSFTAAIGSFNQPNTVFAVGNFDDTSTGRAIVDGGVDGNSHRIYWDSNEQRWQATAGAFGSNTLGSGDDTIQLFTAVFDGSNSVFRENGVQTASNDFGSESLQDLNIGTLDSGNTLFWKGDIGFIEVHDGTPSSGIQTREQEIADMWGITL